MAPHPIGVLLRGTLLASKCVSYHTSRGDICCNYIYIYIYLLHTCTSEGGDTQDCTYQSIRYVCIVYNIYICIYIYICTPNIWIYIYIFNCGSSCWRIRRAILVYNYIQYKVLARPSHVHTHVHRLGGKCHMLIPHLLGEVPHGSCFKA